MDTKNMWVGKTIRYGLVGPEIDFRWGENFRTPPYRSWGPPSVMYIEYRVIPGSKAAGEWRWPPTPSGREVKERVELYLYSTLCAIMAGYRVKFYRHSKYEGWNFNSGNYLFTTDTKYIHVSKFYCPSM